jgi:hypothetical protein
MMAITNSGLCHLGHQRLGISQQQKSHMSISMELLCQPFTYQSVGVASTLHDCPTRRGFTAHKKRDANQPVVTDHCNLRSGSIPQNVEQRNDAICGKINMSKRSAWLIQNLTEPQQDSL